MREQTRRKPGKQHIHILHRMAASTPLRERWLRLPGFQACVGYREEGGGRKEEGAPPITISPTIAVLAFFFLFFFFF